MAGDECERARPNDGARAGVSLPASSQGRGTSALYPQSQTMIERTFGSRLETRLEDGNQPIRKFQRVFNEIKMLHQLVE